MGRTRSKLVAAIWSAVCGSVLMSGMVWTVLTEPRLSAGFWPRDIGKVVVQACGGTTDFRFAADPQIELSWLSVVVRLAALLILGATVSVSWTQLRATPHAARRISEFPPVHDAFAGRFAVGPVAQRFLQFDGSCRTGNCREPERRWQRDTRSEGTAGCPAGGSLLGSHIVLDE